MLFLRVFAVEFMGLASRLFAGVLAPCFVLAVMCGVPLVAGCAASVKPEMHESEREADDPPENTATSAPALEVSGTAWAALSASGTLHEKRTRPKLDGSKRNRCRNRLPEASAWASTASRPSCGV